MFHMRDLQIVMVVVVTLGIVILYCGFGYRDRPRAP
jgi:hypothetical protein